MAYMKDSTGRRLDTYAVREDRTIRASYTNGGQSSGQGTLNAITQRGFRLLVQVPVKTTRWRVRMQNYDNYATSPTTQATLTSVGIAFGKHALGSLFAQTWNYQGNAATVVDAAGATIPGNGTWYESPWITSSGNQLDPFTEYVVGIGYTAASSTNVFQGTGNCRHFTTATDAITGSVAADGTVPGGVPLDVVIEYEARTDRKVGLFVGDSNMEGVGTEGGFMTSWFQSWPRLAAARGNSIANNIALAGTTTYSWGDATFANHGRWKRVPLSTQTVDYAMIALGTNDMAAGTTTATYQSYMKLIVDKIRTEVGRSDFPIFAATIPPRNVGLTAGQETERNTANDWLRKLPLELNGVVDFDRILRDPAAVATLPAYFTTDGIHFTRDARNTLATNANAALPM